jgi:hypothetical protein
MVDELRFDREVRPADEGRDPLSRIACQSGVGLRACSPRNVDYIQHMVNGWED